jgi:hypothetical protein
MAWEGFHEGKLARRGAYFHQTMGSNLVGPKARKMSLRVPNKAGSLKIMGSYNVWPFPTCLPMMLNNVYK